MLFFVCFLLNFLGLDLCACFIPAASPTVVVWEHLGDLQSMPTLCMALAESQTSVRASPEPCTSRWTLLMVTV